MFWPHNSNQAFMDNIQVQPKIWSFWKSSVSSNHFCTIPYSLLSILENDERCFSLINSDRVQISTTTKLNILYILSLTEIYLASVKDCLLRLLTNRVRQHAKWAKTIYIINKRETMCFLHHPALIGKYSKHKGTHHHQRTFQLVMRWEHGHQNDSCLPGQIRGSGASCPLTPCWCKHISISPCCAIAGSMSFIQRSLAYT